MDLEKYIGVVPDFPKKGISFKDVSPLLRDKDAFKETIDRLAEIAGQYDFDTFVGAEARGFAFGAALAFKMGKGFVMARKSGKLPGKTIAYTYTLEYGSATLEVSEGAFEKGKRALLIDDLLATGGTFLAMRELVKKAGGEPLACLAVIALEELHGDELIGLPCHHLLLLSDSH